MAVRGSIPIESSQEDPKHGPRTRDSTLAEQLWTQQQGMQHGVPNLVTLKEQHMFGCELYLCNQALK